MSTQVLPSLVGQSINVVRVPIWNTVVQKSVSGKQTRIGRYTSPLYKWTITFNVVRSGSYNEFQQLFGFFNARQGMLDTFLYQDADDNSVTGQTLSTGDGTTAAFQFVRSLGGFIEPILAPNMAGTIHIYLNGVLQTTGYTVTGWGSSSPGVVTFASAPGSGVAITADFTYYWPVCMDADTLEFNRFLSQYYKVQKFTFQSVRN